MHELGQERQGAQDKMASSPVAEDARTKSELGADHSNAVRNKGNGARKNLLLWLRKTHSWVGLWGAALGLLFGVTGFTLNHRNVLKIPLAQSQESTVQIALPTPYPADAEAMASWLQDKLAIDRVASRVREEKARTVAWGDKAVKQPERWSMSFNSPRTSVQAEYWLGNQFVTVKQNDNNVMATLNNLHKGNGLGIGWVLLIDTLAGSIVLLSLTGILLWTQLNRRRLIGSGIALTSFCVMTGLALQAINS